MAQPYLRGNRWYLKYKDARGRWQDKVCSARTKGQAHELLREIQVAEDRARHGLDVRPPEDGGGTVDELIDWWAEKFLKHKVSYGPCIRDDPKASRRIVTRRLRRLVDVTPGHVEAFLEERSHDLAAETLNHLPRLPRSRVHDGATGEAVRRTESGGRRSEAKGGAPACRTTFAPKRQSCPVLAEMPTKWKCLFATALYTGMRKGELLALRKADVDFSARLITVRRSHDRDTTKGNHQDAIPIAAELVPYLRAAIEGRHLPSWCSRGQTVA